MTLPVQARFAEDLPKPCLLLDPEGGKVIWSNTAAQECFGISAKKLRTSALASILSQVTDPESVVRKVDSERSTVVIRDVDVAEQPAGLTFFPLQGCVGLLVVFEKSFTSRAVQGGSVRSLGQMIGHEIKNPLAGIKGAAQLLREELHSEESRALVDVITSEIDRIRRLAVKLETFGDTDLTSPTRVNVHTLLRKARALMGSADSGVVFTEDYDPSLPHVEGDSDQLMQAIINLIKNAMEATVPSGGEIVLRTRSRSGARRGQTVLPVEIQILDTGAGVPAELQSRVFEPFVTTKPSGQGLGLALVARTAEAHGGLVELSSRPGQTRFSILLPAAKVPFA